MSDEGQGLANYLFGNPTGSFVYAVVRGLFGLELQDGGQTLFWCPGFPPGWPEAKLKVNYAEVSFQRISDANHEYIDYVATIPTPRKLRFRLLISDKHVSRIELNGLPLRSYSETAAIGGTWITVETPPLLDVKLRIELEDRVIEPIEVHAEADSTLSLRLSGAIETWHDWQQSAQKVKCSASTLELTVTSRPGTYYLGVECKYIPVVIPVRISVSAKVPHREVSEKYNVAGLKRIIPLGSFMNASAMLVRSRWRINNDFRLPLDALDAPGGLFRTQWADFELRREDPCFLRIEYGLCGLYDRKLVLSRYPPRVEIPVGLTTEAIAMLYASEFEARLTGSTVGTITLGYESGEPHHLPLIIGKTFDSFAEHFASDTYAIDLPNTDHLNVLVLKTDPQRRLDRLILELSMADACLALIGVTAL
jgi:hypothetical protein